MMVDYSIALGIAGFLLSAGAVGLSIKHLVYRQTAERALVEALAMLPEAPPLAVDIQRAVSLGLVDSPAVRRAALLVEEVAARLPYREQRSVAQGLRQESELGRANYLAKLFSAAAATVTSRTHRDGERGGTIDEHLFSADRPIVGRAEDRLGRRGFAEALAQTIGKWRGADSLVIALYGAWGAGKSSVKNMAIEALQEAPVGDRVVVLEFNPWEIGQSNLLREVFFSEVAVALGRTRGATQAGRRELVRRWFAYAVRIGVPPLQPSTGFSAPAALAALALVVAAVSIRVWLGVLVAAVEVVLFAWWMLARPRDTGLGIDDRRPLALHGRTLREQKASIASALRELPAPLLVVIDDVDRLSNEEIETSFQLVKANADFPNLVYLLLFQRDIVEGKVTGGADFLEKIIQVGFDIPEADQRDLDKFLFEGLDRILADVHLPEPFEQSRWGSLYLGGGRPYFVSVRGVRRFLSSFAFHVRLLMEEVFEANFVDLLGLEILRVFEPAVYRRLPTIKNLLTAQQVSGGGEENKRRLEEVLSGAHRRTAAKEILSILFPVVDSVLAGHGFIGAGRDDDARLAAASPRFFDRYFQLAIPKDDISESAVRRVLGTAHDIEVFRRELLSLGEQGRLVPFLERLDAQTRRIPLSHGVPFLTVLFDVGEALSRRSVGLFELDSALRASRAIYNYLRRFRNEVERAEVLREAVGRSTGLYLPVYFVLMVDEETKRKGTTEAALLSPEESDTIRRLCVGKLERAAANGELERHSHLGFLLYRWREWAGADRPRQFVRGLVERPGGAVQFLSGIVIFGVASGGRARFPRETYSIDLRNVEEFVDIETVERNLPTGSEEALTESERRAVEAFRRALARRRRGAGSHEPQLGEESSEEED